MAHDPAQYAIAAVPHMIRAERQLIDERRARDLWMIDGPRSFLQIVLIRVANTRKIVEFLAEGVVDHERETLREPMIQGHLQSVVGGIAHVEPWV